MIDPIWTTFCQCLVRCYKRNFTLFLVCVSGKPKIFLVQACRGITSQKGEVVDEADDEPRQNMEVDEADVMVTVPHDADTLIAFSTTPGELRHECYIPVHCIFKRRDGIHTVLCLSIGPSA